MFNSVSLATSENEALAASVDANAQALQELQKLAAELQGDGAADPEAADIIEAVKYACDTGTALKVSLSHPCQRQARSNPRFVYLVSGVYGSC